MPVQALDTLDEADQRLVKQMLRGIVDYPDRHLNMMMLSRTKPDEYSYYIGRAYEQAPSPVVQPWRSPNNISLPLIALGYIESTKTEGQFIFTPEALDWYRQSSTATDQDIQQRLGRYLYDHMKAQGDNYGFGPIDMSDAAARLHVPQERIVVNARTLKFMGYIAGGRAFGEHLEDGHIYLTHPRGVSWANAGAPPIGPDGMTVNVTVQVTLRQVLQQAEHSSLSEQDKERFTELMTQLSSEKKKGGNVVETVKNLLDIAKNTKDLWPSIVRFAIDHADDAGQLLQHIPHP